MSFPSNNSIISVFEHQRLTAHDFAQVSDFTWLMAQEFAVFTIKRQSGQWQLKVGHYIGIILLPSGMTLEILPKPIAEKQARNNRQPRSPDAVVQTRQWVQRMLSDLTNAHNSKLPNTKSLGQLSDDAAPLPISAPPLSEWLVTQFLQQLSVYQPTQHYQTQILNQPALQGKLLIKQQLRCNSSQPHKFVSETSRFSQDMLCNRLIKSALLLIEQLVIEQLTFRQSSHATDANNQYRQSKYNSQRISFSIALLPWRQIAPLGYQEQQTLDVLYKQAKRQLDIQPLPQQQIQSGRQLLDLAYWLLQQSSADTGSGVSPQVFPTKAVTPLRLCLLIDMNQAFEQWAAQHIASKLTQTNPSYQPLYQTQRVWLSDAAGQACLSIRPDLLMYHAASSIYSHVIDIKWKPLSHSGAISASDAYQLSSYAQAYQVEQVWLVYPVTDNARQPVALSQSVHSSRDDSDDRSAARSNSVKLWLMPFNVLTGTLTALPY